MTTEATFQEALDADPTDWQTRLVFADWLLEQGDPRWEGMLWLGMERKYPDVYVNRLAPYQKIYWWWAKSQSVVFGPKLPIMYEDCKTLFVNFPTRRAAETAFCRAYPALAAAHPAEFAVGVMV